jgi:hypothetical protein
MQIFSRYQVPLCGCPYTSMLCGRIRCMLFYDRGSLEPCLTVSLQKEFVAHVCWGFVGLHSSIFWHACAKRLSACMPTFCKAQDTMKLSFGLFAGLYEHRNSIYEDEMNICLVVIWMRVQYSADSLQILYMCTYSCGCQPGEACFAATFEASIPANHAYGRVSK